MKKNIGLLSLFVGLIGFGLLIVAYTFKINILPIIGFALIVVCIVGCIVDGQINRTTAPVQPDEENQGTRLDKGQLPEGWYMRGWPK